MANEWKQRMLYHVTQQENAMLYALANLRKIKQDILALTSDHITTTNHNNRKRSYDEMMQHEEDSDVSRIPPKLKKRKKESDEHIVHNIIRDFIDFEEHQCNVGSLVMMAQDNGYPQMNIPQIEKACQLLNAKGRIIYDSKTSHVLKMQ